MHGQHKATDIDTQGSMYTQDTFGAAVVQHAVGAEHSRLMPDSVAASADGCSSVLSLLPRVYLVGPGRQIFERAELSRYPPLGFGDLAAARVQLVCTPPAAQASCCQPRPPGPGQRQQRQWRPQLVEALRVCACVYGLPAPPASQQAVPLHDLARHVYAMRYAYPYANLATLACLRRVSTDASSPPPPPPLPHNQEACRRDQAHAGP